MTDITERIHKHDVCTMPQHFLSEVGKDGVRECLWCCARETPSAEHQGGTDRARG